MININIKKYIIIDKVGVSAAESAKFLEARSISSGSMLHLSIVLFISCSQKKERSFWPCGRLAGTDLSLRTDSKKSGLTLRFFRNIFKVKTPK